MRKQKLYDAIFKKKIKWRSYKEEMMKPPPIGHHLAIECYEKGVYRDVLFADNLMVNPHYTKIIYNAKEHLAEIYPQEVETIIHDLSSVTVFYTNETHFEITRIS